MSEEKQFPKLVFIPPACMEYGVSMHAEIVSSLCSLEDQQSLGTRSKDRDIDFSMITKLTSDTPTEDNHGPFLREALNSWRSAGAQEHELTRLGLGVADELAGTVRHENRYRVVLEMAVSKAKHISSLTSCLGNRADNTIWSPLRSFEF